MHHVSHTRDRFPADPACTNPDCPDRDEPTQRPTDAEGRCSGCVYRAAYSALLAALRDYASQPVERQAAVELILDAVECAGAGLVERLWAANARALAVRK